MIKILSLLGLTAFLCCFGDEYDDLKQQIDNSVTVVFLDFLEKVRNVTEKLVRDDQFRKSRISIQGYMKALREFAKPLKNTERDRGSQDNSAILPQRFFALMAGGTFGATIRDVFGRFFSPYMKIYHETLKNETMVDIWKEVGSNYLPGAPPIYSKPMQFFSHLLAKAVVEFQLVNMLEAGVDTVVEIGKIDLNQLHEEGQMVINQIRQKAFEISSLERQKEKNDYLISLRTASGLIVFYWDKVLEQTESPSFHTQYLDSMKQWAELSEIRNTSETYHVLLHPGIRRDFLNWIELNFDKFFEAATQEYYNHGNAALGSDRFNQSNWAVVKGAVVYSLPVYKKLSEVGFGISEINRFLNRVQHITRFLEMQELCSERQPILESFIRFSFAQLKLVIIDEKTNSKDNQLLLPLRVLRTVVLDMWNNFFIMQNSFYGNTDLQQSESKWNHTRNIMIDELLKSNAFTRKQVEEAPQNFVQAIHRILEKLKKYTDLVDGFDERIDQIVFAFKWSMLYTILKFDEVWDLLLE